MISYVINMTSQNDKLKAISILSKKPMSNTKSSNHLDRMLDVIAINMSWYILWDVVEIRIE